MASSLQATCAVGVRQQILAILMQLDGDVGRAALAAQMLGFEPDSVVEGLRRDVREREEEEEEGAEAAKGRPARGDAGVGGAGSAAGA